MEREPTCGNLEAAKEQTYGNSEVGKEPIYGNLGEENELTCGNLEAESAVIMVNTPIPCRTLNCVLSYKFKPSIDRSEILSLKNILF